MTPGRPEKLRTCLFVDRVLEEQEQQASLYVAGTRILGLRGKESINYNVKAAEFDR